MRLLFTSILGLFFVAAFFAFFLLRSVSGYVDSPDRMLDSAKSVDLRSKIVNLSAVYIAKEVAADPTLEKMSVEQLQLIISGVVTEEWVETTLTTAHTGLRESIHGAQTSALLDLRKIKTAMKKALADLKVQALENCQRLLNPAVCTDAKVSAQKIASFEGRANAAIDQIDDEISLLGSLSGRERKQAKELSQAFDSMEKVGMFALLLLVLLLAGIALLNRRPLSRLLGVTGVVVGIASAIYLLTISLSNRIASDKLAEEIGGQSQGRWGEISTTWIGKMAGDLISGSVLPVSLIGLAGALFVLLSFYLRSTASKRNAGRSVRNFSIRKNE